MILLKSNSSRRVASRRNTGWKSIMEHIKMGWFTPTPHDVILRNKVTRRVVNTTPGGCYTEIEKKNKKNKSIMRKI